MKKKIFTFFIVSLFLFIGISSSTIAKKETITIINTDLTKIHPCNITVKYTIVVKNGISPVNEANVKLVSGDYIKEEGSTNIVGKWSSKVHGSVLDIIVDSKHGILEYSKFSSEDSIFDPTVDVHYKIILNYNPIPQNKQNTYVLFFDIITKLIKNPVFFDLF